MADNVQITPGAGVSIAADEVNDATLGSCKVQYVKLMDGTLNGTSKATVGASGLAVHAAQNGTWNVAVSGIAASQPTSGGILPGFGASMSNGNSWTPLSNAFTAANIGPVGVSTLAVAPFVFNGTAYSPTLIPAVYKDLSAVSVGVLATVWTPASGKKIRLLGGILSVSGNVSLLFEDNSSGNFVFRTPMITADTAFRFDLPGGRLLSAANNVLKLTQTPNSPSVTVTGTLFGIEE